MTRINKNQIKIPGGATGQALIKQSNNDFDYDWQNQSGSGGGGGFGGSSQFLAIMQYFHTLSGGGSSSGNVSLYQTLENVATSRIYALYGGLTGSGPQPLPGGFRIFRNVVGSYVYINNTPFNTVGGLLHKNACLVTDGSFIYQISTYSTLASLNADPFTINISRFELDGTFDGSTELYAATNGTRLENVRWASANGVAATIVGDSLFVTYSTRPTTGDPWQEEVREYTISGMTFTLANTYTVPSAIANVRNMEFDNSTSTFYLGNEKTIRKYTIVGSVFTGDTTVDYTSDIGLMQYRANDNVYISRIKAIGGGALSLDIVRSMIGRTILSGGDETVSATQWLEKRNYPTF